MNKPVEKTSKSRSPVERAIVWGGIIVLIGIVGLEYRAQTGYSASLDAISNASGNTEELEFAAVESLLSGGPSRTKKSENRIETHYVYSWFSLFRSGQYVINVLASKDEPSTMLRFYTGDGVDPMKPIPPANPTALPPGGLSLSAGGGGNRGNNAGSSNNDAEESSNEPASSGASVESENQEQEKLLPETSSEGTTEPQE
ncbi:MAG: hypothetical protein KDA91_09505 [Planctomycetaceae bacterium]|nr:hypothetical protein [Planctomycetaceae bacterium]